MKFSGLIASPGEWLRADGPQHDIVISSRVRLARNLRELPFPGWAKKAERIAILDQLKPQVEALPEMDDAFTETSSSSRRWKNRCSSSGTSSAASTPPRASAARWS